MMIPTGTKISETLGEIVIAKPVEFVGGEQIEVCIFNENILMFDIISPNNEIPKTKKHYFTCIDKEYCDCLGFKYHGRCKHCIIARNVRMQREQRKHYVQPLRVLGVAA